MQTMGRLGEYITNNFQVVSKLIKAGKVSLTVKQEYEVYQYFQTTAHLKSTMQRYENTAEAMNVSIYTVMRCVKEMKKAI